MLDLEKGARREAAPHCPDIIEHVIVMTGRAEVGPDGETSTIREGDRVTFLADRPTATTPWKTEHGSCRFPVTRSRWIRAAARSL